MTRLLSFVPLIAAGAVLALTSAAQAQLLSNGMQDDSSLFGFEVITLNDTVSTDPNPADGEGIGNPVGNATDNSTLSQINFETGHDIPYGAFPGSRTYSFTEVNILDVNLNSNPASGGNVEAIYNNCEVNLFVPEAPAFPDSSTGFIGNNATLGANSTLNMTGGLVGNLSTISGTANVSGGSFGNFTTFNGTVNLTGTASISSTSDATSGAVINIDSADATAFAIDLQAGSTANVSNGTIGNGSCISGVANLTGGRINSFTTIGGTANVSNTDPAIDTVIAASVTIVDGGTVNVTTDNVTIFQNMTVDAGGTLNMGGGTLSNGLDIAGVVNITAGGTGGSNTGQYDVEAGGVLNVSGGILGSSSLNIQSGGVVNQSGGDLGVNTDVENGGVLNISGGIFGAGPNADGTGPQFPSADLDVESGGTVNFIGTAFAIDSTPINLVEGTPTMITDRGVLTGTLADGQTIEFNLNTAAPDSFAAGSTITVALPATTVLLGDVNLDGMVNFLDISPFIQRLTNQEFQAEADVNQDGAVSFLDIAPFIQTLTNAGS